MIKSEWSDCSSSLQELTADDSSRVSGGGGYGNGNYSGSGVTLPPPPTPAQIAAQAAFNSAVAALVARQGYVTSAQLFQISAGQTPTLTGGGGKRH